MAGRFAPAGWAALQGQLASAGGQYGQYGQYGRPAASLCQFTN